MLANAQLWATPTATSWSRDLEAADADDQHQGAEIKRQAAEERERIARPGMRINEFERQRDAPRSRRARRSRRSSN